MGKNSKSIAVFPGQGSQFVGMGISLYNEFKVAKEIFEESSDSLSLDIKKLCADGPSSTLELTENTQPAILVVSVAAFMVAKKELGFEPDLVAGHSLGEYSALVCTESLGLSSTVRLVRERGRAMQTAVPIGEGTMAAVLNIDEDTVVELCKTATKNANFSEKFGGSVPYIVEPANFNSPGQVVISGSTLAISEFLRLIKSNPGLKSAKVVPLRVSAPFHCSLMNQARISMSKIFLSTTKEFLPEKPKYPYIPNFTAKITREKEEIFNFLEKQIVSPVLWRQSVLSSVEYGVSEFVEFGPGKVLQGLIKRTLPIGSSNFIYGVGCAESIREFELISKNKGKD